MSIMPFPDEISLWKSFRSGSEIALEHLIRSYTTPLTYYGRKMVSNDDLIQDCIQETFIELWQYRAGLRDLTEIKPYLLTCLRRKIVKALKVENFVTLEEHNADHLFNLHFTIEDQLIENETEADTVRILNSYINSLSKRRKEIIYLKYYENLSNEEIAAVMGIKYQTATNLLHEALNSLRNLIPSQSTFPLLFIWTELFLK